MQAYRKVGSEVVALRGARGPVSGRRADGLLRLARARTRTTPSAAVRAALDIVHAVKAIGDPTARRSHRHGHRHGGGGRSFASWRRRGEAGLGETPNLAARLQGLAGPDEVVIAPATRRLLVAAASS